MENLIVTSLIISVVVLILLLVFFLLFLLTHKEKVSKALSDLIFFKKDKNKKSYVDLQKTKDILFDAIVYCSKNKIGALIVFENRNDLTSFTDNGFKLNAEMSSEFIISIFANKSVSFHDGAMIIRGNKIVAVSCYVPISKSSIDLKYGARHRAALGLTEITDAVAFICSENNGDISTAVNGKLSTIGKDKDNIKNTINRLI